MLSGEGVQQKVIQLLAKTGCRYFSLELAGTNLNGAQVVVLELCEPKSEKIGEESDIEGQIGVAEPLVIECALIGEAVSVNAA